MKLKRLLAALLAAATLLAGMAIPAAAAPAAGFTDVADPATAQAAELLRLLGILQGDGSGLFYPEGKLTRAEFCKMVILVRGEGDKADAQMSRTIFTDVKGGHWARGFINYASSIVIGGSGVNAERLVMGRGDGSFGPDDFITCDQAVTMAMRLLGYTAADLSTGVNWYDGYVTAARDLGLLDGLTLDAESPITRGQTAILFRNLLFTPAKGSGQPYMSALGCTITEPVLLLSVNATAPDGTTGAVKTASGVYKTDHAPFDAALEGRQVKVMLSGAGKVLAIEPVAESASTRTITVAETQPAGVVASNGDRLEVTGDAVVYDKGEETTYAAIYLDIPVGSAMTLRYSAAGKLEYIFLTRSSTPGQADTTRTVDLAGAEPDYVVTQEGEQVRISPETTAYTSSGTLSTYAQLYASLAAGDQLTLCYTAAGKLKYVRAVKPTTSTGEGSYRTLTVAEAEASYVLTDGGERVSLPRKAVVYDNGAKTTYDAVYLDIRPGSKMRLQYNADGALEYIFLTRVAKAEDAVVVKSLTGNDPFAALVGTDTGYAILKNGVAASRSDLRQYDVVTYDKTTKTLSLSDVRLTGVYLSASPSPKSPDTINVLGADFPVLPSAIEDLSAFQVGDTITILFTADGQVAGAVSPNTARSTAVGVVTECSTTQASVRSLDLKKENGEPVVFHGAVSYSDYSAQRMQGVMVTVSSTKQDKLNLSRLTGITVKGDLDVKGRTLGGVALAPNVTVYERVGAGAPQPIHWAQITQDTVTADHISYVSTDYAGRVNYLVLDSVTGDGLTYGFAAVSQETTDYFGGSSVENTCVTVGSTGPLVMGGAAIRTGDAVGIAASLEKMGSVQRLAGWEALHCAKNISRTAFTMTSGEEGAPIGTVTTPELVIPIAADVLCYNAVTKEYFASLDEARSYASSLTIYYDRSPEEGGKVRLVVAE